MKKNRISAGLLLSFGCLIASMGMAKADYPERPVTMVVPFAAGGPTDVAARIIAQAMSESLGQPLVIDNRPGAASMIGAAYAAEAENNGYTLLMGTTSTFATNPHVYTNIAYDPMKFTPVAHVVKVPLAFATRTDLPVSTIAELVAYSEAQSLPMQYASAGAGSHSSLSCFLAAREIGVEMEEIPYQGTGPALTDLMAGAVDVLCDAIGTISGPYKENRVKLVGQLDDERSVAIPDVPTFVESGYPDLVINNWFAVMGPEGMPENVVDKVGKAIEHALSKEDVAARLLELGFVPQFMAAAEFHEFMSAEYERFRQVVEDAGVRIE